MRPRRSILKGIGAAVGASILAGCAGDSEPEEVDDPDDEYVRVGPIDIPSIAPEWNPTWHETYVKVAEQCSELGIDVNVEPLPLVEWIDRLVDPNRPWAACANGRSGGPDRWDPAIYLGRTYHLDEATRRGANYSWWGRAEDTPEQHENANRYSELLDESNRTPESDDRRKLIQEAQELLAVDVPNVWLYYSMSLAGYNATSFDGWTPLKDANPFGHALSLQELEPGSDGRVVRFATNQPVHELNYAAYTRRGPTWQMLTSLIYDRLVEVGFDARPQGALAEAWEWHDPVTLEMSLRSGLVHHDGKPLTAEDVKFTIEFNQRWTPPSHHRHVSIVEEVEIHDDRTFTLHLIRPSASLLSVNLIQLPIIPAHIWDGVTDEFGLDDPGQWTEVDLTGTGPMRVVEFDPPDTIVYEVVDEHWRTFGFERYVVENYGLTTDAVDALEANAADFVVDVPRTEFARIRGMTHARAVAVPTAGYQALTMRNEEPPFNDRALRRAFAHAVDPAEIVEAALDGLATPARSQTPIAEANEFWHNPDVQPYQGGPDGGRELLREAGYQWNEDEQLIHEQQEIEGDRF